MDFESIFFANSDFNFFTEEIGSGTFGTVYKAEKYDDKKLYAAKVIKSDDGYDGPEQLKIFREALILRNLQHPLILKFHGINFQSRDDGTKIEPTIITDYMENGSLKKVLNMTSPAWTPTKKYIILLGIVNAMWYLHEHGIIHRDLKPQNILIDEKLYPRICDFGLARFFPDLLSKSINLYSKSINLTTGIGSPLYMAPELIDGDKYGFKIDVYAFSMIAYEIIAGKEPFFEIKNRNSSFKIFDHVLNGNRPIFTEVFTEKMKSLLSKCWSANTKKRPSFKEIYDLLSNDFTDFKDEINEEEVRQFIDHLNKENEK